MKTIKQLLCLCFLTIFVPAHAVASSSLVVDLSSNQIEITTDFTGTNLLLFGAIDRKGDVVVVVRGPLRQEVVRRKERVAGIWINRAAVTFADVPGYNFVASSRPLDQIASEETLRRLQIGSERLRLQPVDLSNKDLASSFRNGLIDLKKRKALYSDLPGIVSIRSEKLFRADLKFPSNVPTGSYTAEIYHFNAGKAVSVSRTNLSVQKAGVEAAIYNYAHDHSALYGIVAILIALFAGWLGGVVFRKA
ncbi:MAG: hypothetical protein GKS01_07935 [Alphaproteobacteria bacterium]|nr:hypothetical protein [Alphaproteobacteria bacterium]